MADANEDDWLDPIVKRAVDKTIDRLAKGREHIMKERSREILCSVVHDAVLDVLAEICDVGNEQGEMANTDGATS